MIALGNLSHYISTYGYAAVFLLSILEGPAVTILAAILASQGILNLPLVYAIVVVADLVGDLLCYTVGRCFSECLADSARPRVVRFRRRIEVLQPYIQSRAGRILLFGKLTHSAGYAVLLAAGAARVRLFTFAFYNFLGTVPKSAFFVVVGYFFGRHYESLESDIRLAVLAVLILMCAVTAPFI